MNRNQLVSEVSNRTGEDIKVVRSIVTTMITIVKEKLLFGINVNITDLVSFSLAVSPETRKKNPQTQEEMIIPRRYRVKATLPTAFKKQLRDKTVY
jgi:nucleoid DNA-binding protein